MNPYDGTPIDHQVPDQDTLPGRTPGQAARPWVEYEVTIRARLYLPGNIRPEPYLSGMIADYFEPGPVVTITRVNEVGHAQG